MFKSEFFVTFMLSLRIGKKSIPLWFRSFLDAHKSEYAFKNDLMMEGIKYVSDLFKDKNCELIFLADRYFSYPAILNYIESLGHTYIIRLKSTVKVKYFEKTEGHKITKLSAYLFHYKYKATYYENIELYRDLYKTNIVFSPTKSVSISKKTETGEVEEPWILVTNGNVKRAIKDYSYRYGAIEFLFKGQKSNRFDLNKSNTRNIQAYSMIYMCINLSILYLTYIGTYYTRHKGKYYRDIKYYISV